MKRQLAALLSLAMLTPAIALPASALGENGKPTYEEALTHISITSSAEKEVEGMDCYVPSVTYRLGDWYYEGEEQIPEECDFGDGVYDFREETGYNAIRSNSTITVTNTATDINCYISLYLDVYTNEIYGDPEETTSGGGMVNAGVGTHGPKVSLPEGTYVYLVDQGNYLRKSGRWGALGAAYSEEDIGTEVEVYPGESFTFDFSDIEITDTMKSGLGQPEDDNIYALQAAVYYPDLNYVWRLNYHFRVDEAFIDGLKAAKNAPSDWAKAEIDLAKAANLVPALTGTPGYHDAITREQFAELAVNLVEKAGGRTIQPAPATTFTDCANPAVLKAYAAGIVNGTSDAAFSPKAPLTPEQLATMLYRAWTYLDKNAGASAGAKALDGYSDRGQVSAWAYDALSALAAAGVMNGTSPTTLSPKGDCTVEQSVLLVYRMYGKAEK